MSIIKDSETSNVRITNLTTNATPAKSTERFMEILKNCARDLSELNYTKCDDGQVV